MGHTRQLSQDAFALHHAARKRLGDVYAIRVIGVEQAVLHGPDAIEAVLMDRNRTFSSQGGWRALSDLFRGGLMIRDFDDHRRHRRIMNMAFNAPAMRDYLALMNDAMEVLVGRLPRGEAVAIYPRIKENTLRVGASVLMGLPADAPEARAMNRAFMTQINAALTPLRWAVPLSPLWRGLRARDRIRGALRDMIAERRRTGGDDFFSRMCRATDDEGRAWSDDEIVDHFNFLLFAAHDTTATTISAMLAYMARYPAWQEAMAEEIASLGCGPLQHGALERLVVTKRVFQESLRLCPPVPFIPRELVKPFAWGGYEIPVGAGVVVMPGIVMRDPSIWPEPERFDPDRFAPARVEDRSHRFAWAPFGGGVHKCLGLHFALMEARVFMVHLLRHSRVRLAEGRLPDWQMLPIPRPKDDLPLVITPIRPPAGTFRNVSTRHAA